MHLSRDILNRMRALACHCVDTQVPCLKLGKLIDRQVCRKTKVTFQTVKTISLRHNPNHGTSVTHVGKRHHCSKFI